MRSPDLPLQPGDVVAGKYRVERVLGSGGMGGVLAATVEGGAGRVAIKCILPLFAGDPQIVARFRREVRVTSRLAGEHVARVIEAGDLPGDGGPFVVMEYLEGRDLQEIVDDRGPLPIGEAAACVAQACVGLAEAHALGIVHRDLKPSNLFRVEGSSGGCIKLLDFGVAKVEGPGEDIELEEVGRMIGSRRYMAPEQRLDASSVDARADVWSLGMILRYLATGTADAGPGLPVELAAVVGKCLEERREDRFASVGELAGALAPFD